MWYWGVTHAKDEQTLVNLLESLQDKGYEIFSVLPSYMGYMGSNGGFTIVYRWPRT